MIISDTLVSKAQWTQSSLTKELATQQTFQKLQNSFRPKIQNKLGELDVLIKQLLVTKTNTCSSDDIPPPLEDDDPVGTKGLPIEDPEDHNPPPECKEYCPHWESLPFRRKARSQEAYQHCKHKSLDALPTPITTTLHISVVPNINFLNYFSGTDDISIYLGKFRFKDCIYWSLPMVEKAPSLYPSLPDDSSSDEEIPDLLKTTIEERCYGTIPGSDTATIAALAHSNPKQTQSSLGATDQLRRRKRQLRVPRWFWYPGTHLPAILYPVSAPFCELSKPVS